MRALPHTHSCFVCGESNAAGLKLRFETDGKIVRARFCPGPEHIGFRSVIHGGLIATVLDEIMVWACAVQTKRFCFCAELNTRFLRPLEPGQETIATAELVVNRKGRLFEAKSTLSDAAGTIYAEGAGKYLPIKTNDEQEMLRDLIGDASWLLKS